MSCAESEQVDILLSVDDKFLKKARKIKGIEMIAIEKKTDHQIKLLGLKAAKNELGVMGFIRFIQQFEIGEGNYTEDRKTWQKNYTVEFLADEIKKSENKR